MKEDLAGHIAGAPGATSDVQRQQIHTLQGQSIFLTILCRLRPLHRHKQHQNRQSWKEAPPEGKQRHGRVILPQSRGGG